MVLRMPIDFLSSLPALALERAALPLIRCLRKAALWLQDYHRRSRDRAELAQMSSRELNDLGISRCDIDGVMDAPDWRGDRL
jgi:uncharacterized protein YjiS (DUF1127 family)